jgi:hypothetical protein
MAWTIFLCPVGPAGGRVTVREYTAAKLSVPSSQRSLHVEFNSISFVDEKDIRLRYRLTGLDPGWTTMRTNRPLDASLLSGSYIFAVTAVFTLLGTITLLWHRLWRLLKQQEELAAIIREKSRRESILQAVSLAAQGFLFGGDWMDQIGKGCGCGVGALVRASLGGVRRTARQPPRGVVSSWADASR